MSKSISTSMRTLIEHSWWAALRDARLAVGKVVAWLFHQRAESRMSMSWRRFRLRSRIRAAPAIAMATRRTPASKYMSASKRINPWQVSPRSIVCCCYQALSLHKRSRCLGLNVERSWLNRMLPYWPSNWKQPPGIEIIFTPHSISFAAMSVLNSSFVMFFLSRFVS